MEMKKLAIVNTIVKTNVEVKKFYQTLTSFDYNLEKTSQKLIKDGYIVKY